jgi:hypothetical protein
VKNNQKLLTQWERRISAWKKSGLSQKEFCQKANLSLHQFTYWQRKVSRQGKVEESPSFLPVVTGEQFSIVLGQTKISFERPPSPSWMASFIKSFQAADAHC